MINTACTFIQYLNNNKIKESEMIAGFTVNENEVTIYLSDYPKSENFMKMVEIWKGEFNNEKCFLFRKIIKN